MAHAMEAREVVVPMMEGRIGRRANSAVREVLQGNNGSASNTSGKRFVICALRT
jgi:hypothetical protein